MESRIEQEMKANGIVQETIDILKEEGITSTKVFKCLRLEHFKKLLEETHIQIGQHALLMKIFDDFKSVTPVSAYGYIHVHTTRVNYCSVQEREIPFIMNA